MALLFWSSLARHGRVHICLPYLFVSSCKQKPVYDFYSFSPSLAVYTIFIHVAKKSMVVPGIAIGMFGTHGRSDTSMSEPQGFITTLLSVSSSV